MLVSATFGNYFFLVCACGHSLILLLFKMTALFERYAETVVEFVELFIETPSHEHSALSLKLQQEELKTLWDKLKTVYEDFLDRAVLQKMTQL